MKFVFFAYNCVNDRIYGIFSSFSEAKRGLAQFSKEDKEDMIVSKVYVNEPYIPITEMYNWEELD